MLGWVGCVVGKWICCFTTSCVRAWGLTGLGWRHGDQGKPCAHHRGTGHPQPRAPRTQTALVAAPSDCYKHPKHPPTAVLQPQVSQPSLLSYATTIAILPLPLPTHRKGCPQTCRRPWIVACLRPWPGSDGTFWSWVGGCRLLCHLFLQQQPPTPPLLLVLFITSSMMTSPPSLPPFLAFFFSGT